MIFDMRTSTVNISLEKNLLKEIDEWARQEFRTRSDLIREAARSYIERRKTWQKIFRFGKSQARKMKPNEQDVFESIRNYRKGLR